MNFKEGDEVILNNPAATGIPIRESGKTFTVVRAIESSRSPSYTHTISRPLAGGGMGTVTWYVIDSQLEHKSKIVNHISENYHV